MKKSTAFGAVLCSAALACSMAMPALAAAPNEMGINETGNATGTATNGSGNATGSTLVNVIGYNSDEQISAELPINLTVSAPSAGGVLTTPSADKYTITNTCDLPLTIANVKGTLDADFQFNGSNPATTIGASANATKNLIYLTVAEGKLGTPVVVKSGNTNLGWTLPAKADGATAAEPVKIQLAGDALPGEDLTDGFNTATAVKAITLQYTIATVS